MTSRVLAEFLYESDLPSYLLEVRKDEKTGKALTMFKHSHSVLASGLESFLSAMVFVLSHQTMHISARDGLSQLFGVAIEIAKLKFKTTSGNRRGTQRGYVWGRNSTHMLAETA